MHAVGLQEEGDPEGSKGREYSARRGKNELGLRRFYAKKGKGESIASRSASRAKTREEEQAEMARLPD